MFWYEPVCDRENINVRLKEWFVRCIVLPKAFVLINAEIGAESEVTDELRSVPDVKEAHVVYGVYDIICMVEAKTMDRLKEIITWNIRRLDKVRSTLTMIVMEGV